MKFLIRHYLLIYLNDAFLIYHDLALFYHPGIENIRAQEYDLYNFHQYTVDQY